MKNIIKNMPVAISGLLLAIFSLGNLYEVQLIRNITLFLGILILGMCILKIIFHGDTVKNELGQLVILSTSGTFSMSLMLFATFIIPLNHGIAMVIWMIGILLHGILITLFSYRYVFQNFDIKNVYASYWVVFIGITMASITGLSFNLENYTWIFFVFGFVMMLITFPLVTYRYVRYPVELEQNKPLICIYAAVMNILIVGYLNSFTNVSMEFVLTIYVAALICYAFSLFKFMEYVKMPFYPSYSAFTFPFVISAIASSKMLAVTGNNPIINIILLFQTLIATLLVIYVFCRYTIYLLR